MLAGSDDAPPQAAREETAITPKSKVIAIAVRCLQMSESVEAMLSNFTGPCYHSGYQIYSLGCPSP